MDDRIAYASGAALASAIIGGASAIADVGARYIAPAMTPDDALTITDVPGDPSPGR